MVRDFSTAGYRVSFTYHTSEDLATALADETGALAIRADSASEAEANAAVEIATSRFGGVDILINNAGIAAFSLFTDITSEEWQRVMGVNLNGAFYFTKACVPHMIHEKWGRIINISSIWGITGSSCEVHYSTSKAALIGLTRALAKELGPSQITVNCIAPGVIDTDMNKCLTPQTLEALCEETPLGRLGTPEEIASLAVYLASDAAAFLTGQVISPNGGLVI
jgi:3-oxoacyl-[acyl-carrier protein] reductase